MAKRQTARQQRRKAPEHSKTRQLPGRPPEHPHQAPRAPKAVPPEGSPGEGQRWPAGEFARLFGEKSLQESFAELVEQALSDPAQQRALHEKRQPGGRPAARRHDYPAPQAELDLHGLTGPEAEDRIESFVRVARGRGLVTLRIVTGKGLHSDGPAVLPQVAEHKIRELKALGLVARYRWEGKRREGSGAIRLSLR